MDKIIKNKTPVMGHIIIEAIKVKRSDFEKEKAQIKGVSQDFLDKFVISTNDEHGAYAPVNCGRVLKLSKDSFGKAYAHNYGDDTAELMRTSVKEGTLVYFIPNQSYRIDSASKFHMIADTHILMIEEEVTEEIKEEVN